MISLSLPLQVPCMPDSPLRPWYVRHWALLALLVLLAAQHLLYRWMAYLEHERRSRSSMRQIAVFSPPPPDHLENVAGTKEGKDLEAIGHPSWLEWSESFGKFQSARLEL